MPSASMSVLISCALLLIVVAPGCASQSGSRGGFATVSGAIGRTVTAPFRHFAKESRNPAASGSSKAGGATIPDVATIQQSANPSGPSAQNYDFGKTDEIIYSQDTAIVTEHKQPDGSSIVVTQHIPAGSKQRVSTNQRVGQVIGAAQVDQSANLTAKLGSFRMIQWIGAIALLVGCAGFAHPAGRVLIGGKDTAIMVGLSGLVMIFGPVLFVTYEKYFFLAIVAAVAYWFWSRAKHKEGVLDGLMSGQTKDSS